jgi:hypothetical protein
MFCFARVERCEVRVAHVNFAAHLYDLRRARRKLLGNFGYGADIGRDVLADRPVATGCSQNQLTALVAKRRRQAVDLRLCREDQVRLGRHAEKTPDAAKEVAHLVFPKGIVQGQHRG